MHDIFEELHAIGAGGDHDLMMLWAYHNPKVRSEMLENLRASLADAQAEPLWYREQLAADIAELEGLWN
jgi:hypothetical protein